MELIKNAAITIIALTLVFWYFGGFKLIRFLKTKRLKKSLTSPLNTDAIRSAHQAYAAGAPLPNTLSFTEYAIFQRLDEKDTWAKSAYDKTPDNPVAAYFYAGLLLAEMYALRGSSTVDKLTSDQISKVFVKLEEAEKIIQIFAKSQLSPADATAMLIDVYIHLGKHAEINSLVQQNSKFLRGRIDVVSRYLRSLYPRWGGSHEALQQEAEEFSLQEGPLLAAKALAYCHLLEDRDEKEYKDLIKKKPLTTWLRAYEQLPKAPAQIRSCEDYNLLLAHKFFARFFLYINDTKYLKRAIKNITGHFAADEMINPHSKSPISFYEAAVEVGAL